MIAAATNPPSSSPPSFVCEIRQPRVLHQASGGECGYYALTSIITAVRHFRKEGLDRTRYKEVLEPALVDNEALLADTLERGKSILLAEQKNHDGDFFWNPELISAGEFFPDMVTYLIDNKGFMSAYELEAGSDIMLINSDLLMCVEYDDSCGYSAATKEALGWIAETFAKDVAAAVVATESPSMPLVRGFLIGAANHWVGMVLAKQSGIGGGGDESVLVFFDSMNWKVIEPLPDYYEAGTKHFDELVAAGKVKPSERLYDIKTFLIRMKYVKEELATGSTTVDKRIANQKVMNVVISYEQAKRLNYAEMNPYEMLCAWACDNPQKFYDDLREELQQSKYDVTGGLQLLLDEETVESASEMASSIISVLERSDQRANDAALKTKLQSILEIARLINMKMK